MENTFQAHVSRPRRKRCMTTAVVSDRSIFRSTFYDPLHTAGTAIGPSSNTLHDREEGAHELRTRQAFCPDSGALGELGHGTRQIDRVGEVTSLSAVLPAALSSGCSSGVHARVALLRLTARGMRDLDAALRLIFCGST